MILTVASFNVENLFRRPAAMAPDAGQQGQDAIDALASLNEVISHAEYSSDDKDYLLQMDSIYRFSAMDAPQDALLRLNNLRGHLFSNVRRQPVVAASGRGDWIGWFELRTDNVTWEATYNTGHVIADTRPDILICVEVEDRPTLLRFNEQILQAEFDMHFPHVMLIDGNDPRGIDVGIMSRYPIHSICSHVDDVDADQQRVFSRDCPEYLIGLPDGKQILFLPNHFKSKRGGNSPQVIARRKAQADRAHAIALNGLASTPYVMLAGDLNDTPETPIFASLWQDGFTDIGKHPSYPAIRPGTYNTGLEKIDYMISSTDLFARLTDTGIERRGTYHPELWESYPEVTGKATEASDHHLIWGKFEM